MAFGGHGQDPQAVPAPAPFPAEGERGKFFILRRADATKAAWLEERVEPANDYARAFARPPKLLIAVAVFSDSDDTRKRNSALIENLVLQE